MAFNIAAQFGLCEGKTVAIFSLEIPKVQIVQKLMCLYSGISMGAALGEKLTADDWKQVKYADDALIKSNIVIDDSSVITTAYVAEKCKQIIEKYGGLDIIIIDCVREELKNLKFIADRFKVPVILTCRANYYDKNDNYSIVHIKKSENQLLLTLNGEQLILDYDFATGRLSATK